MHSELLAQIVLSTSTCPFVLLLLLLILSHVEPPLAHHLCSGTSTAPRSIRALLFSRTRSVSAILPLHVSILASPVKFFSSSRSDSLSEFISPWFCRISLRCKQRVSRTTSHVSVCFNIRRHNVESSTLNLWSFLGHNTWQKKSRSFFVSDELSSSILFL